MAVFPFKCKQGGKIRIATLDVGTAKNNWGLILEKISEHQIDVICIQETRLKKKEAIGTAKRKARTLLWSSCHTEAARTEADKATGGCAVAARRGVGISDEACVKTAEGTRHRI